MNVLDLYVDKEAICDLHTLVYCGAVYYMVRPQKRESRKLEDFGLHAVYLRVSIAKSDDGVITRCFLESREFGDDVFTYNLFLPNDVYAMGESVFSDYSSLDDMSFHEGLVNSLYVAFSDLCQKISNAGAIRSDTAFLADIERAFHTCISELFSSEDIR